MGVVGDDGAFELAGGMGPVFFRVAAPPAWTLKSVLLEGVDITDTLTDLTGRDGLSGLTVVLTDKLTDVSGQVTDARGRALKDYAVVVLPSESEAGAGHDALPPRRAARPGRSFPPPRSAAGSV